MRTIHHRGDGETTDFAVLEPLSSPSSILAVTVDGVPGLLDAEAPLTGALTVKLAAPPADGANVAISYKSAAVDGEF